MLIRQTGGRNDVERARRACRLLVGAAVALAAIGAPLLMQGTVALVTNLAPSATKSPVVALAMFVLSSLPLVLAWLAWRRTQHFRRFLDQELWATPREPLS